MCPGARCSPSSPGPGHEVNRPSAVGRFGACGGMQPLNPSPEQLIGRPLNADGLSFRKIGKSRHRACARARTLRLESLCFEDERDDEDDHGTGCHFPSPSARRFFAKDDDRRAGVQGRPVFLQSITGLRPHRNALSIISCSPSHDCRAPNSGTPPNHERPALLDAAGRQQH